MEAGGGTGAVTLPGRGAAGKPVLAGGGAFPRKSSFEIT
jgi:hypothetical protein